MLVQTKEQNIDAEAKSYKFVYVCMYDPLLPLGIIALKISLIHVSSIPVKFIAINLLICNAKRNCLTFFL